MRYNNNVYVQSKNGYLEKFCMHKSRTLAMIFMGVEKGNRASRAKEEEKNNRMK